MNGQSESCGSCRFWRRNEKGKPSGVCRQTQPTAFIVAMVAHQIMKNQQIPIVDSFWPPIPESEWCGQWNAAPKSYADIDLSKLSEMPSA
jgi:hypothetical protein